MTSAAELVEQADALLDGVDAAAVDADLASLLASYQAARERRDPAAWIVARAVVRCAARVGVEPKASDTAGDSTSGKALADMTVKELRGEIDSRNEGRDEAARLSKSGSKDELLSALVADDATE